MKFVFVFMKLGEAKLVAGVDDGGGKFRRVEATWRAVDDGHLPPKSWADTVRGEVDLRRTEDTLKNPVRKFL